MNKLEAFITLLTKPDRLKALLSYGHKGYFANIGWFSAFDARESIDKDGNPLPWVTYSFIDFIRTRLNKSMTVFEYGAGNSTLFYASRVQSVVSVEHDQAWYKKLLSTKPENADLIYCQLDQDGAYAHQVMSLDKKFDLIIIDGRDRVNCCKNCISALNPGGVVILDDSQVPRYEMGINYLKAAGFKELPFSGIAPGLFYYKSTSVFYKPENCLQI